MSQRAETAPTGEPPPVFVITGQIAAGKSTVARALLDFFEFGFLIDVDGIREMVTRGLASPLTPSDETERQFALALRASAQLAMLYNQAGFAVAIEGALDPRQALEVLDEEGLGRAMVGVELCPTLDVALKRNSSRTNKSFDTSVLEGAIRAIDAEIRDNPAPPSFAQIDNSDETPDQTVSRILRLPRAGAAS